LPIEKESEMRRKKKKGTSGLHNNISSRPLPQQQQ
jgi:hypothetical protein